MGMLGKPSGKKSLVLMNKVVFFLPALTFPSWAGNSPHRAVGRSGVWDGAWGCPGTPELFHGERAGPTPKTSTWLSLVHANPPRYPPGNTTGSKGTAPGVNGHLPGTDPQGWDRKGVLHPFSDTGDHFCAQPKPLVWAPASRKLSPSGASLLSPPALVPGVRCCQGLPALGHPSIPIRERPTSHQPCARHGARDGLVFRGKAWVLRCLQAQVQGPGHHAQPNMERVTVHINKYEILSKRKNTCKTCPLDIRV